MAKLPEQFCEEFDNRGDKFFEVAELLYTNHGQQYTQSELAEKVNRSNKRISDYTSDMGEEGWLNRHDGETTFVWNTKAHNPAETEVTYAISGFYADLWHILKKHSKTIPGTFAILGSALFVAALVLFSFYIGLSITEQSNVPIVIYLVIAISSFLTGMITTVLSPLQALANRLLHRLLPFSLLQNKE